MIRYLRHREIDKTRWDTCVLKSVNSLVYGLSWYLDLVSPGWDALVEDEYQSVFPLTHRRKWGIRYLAQPFFTQQLGVFSTGHLTPTLVTRFLEAIPLRFRLAEIHLNSLNQVEPGSVEVTRRVNHELELLFPYHEINSRYSQNTRRNLRKAIDKGVEVIRKVTADDLINLFRRNYGSHEGKLSYRDYVTMHRLISTSVERALAVMTGAGEAGRLDAAACFLKDRDRYIMLFAGSDYTNRDNGAMFLVLDSFIREHAGQPTLLDFEGGKDPNLGRFYKSFGARESYYPFIRIIRIPGYRLFRKF